MTSYYDIEYTDENGTARKARMQSVNGVHTEELIREWIDTRKTFGDRAEVTKIAKITDSAQIAATAASRPPLPPAIVKNIQAAENAAAAGQPAAEAFPAAPDQGKASAQESLSAAQAQQAASARA